MIYTSFSKDYDTPTKGNNGECNVALCSAPIQYLPVKRHSVYMMQQSYASVPSQSSLEARQAKQTSLDTSGCSKKRELLKKVT